MVELSGLENIITRPLVFTSASGCRASENFDSSSENYFFPILAMQDKYLFSDILRPGYDLGHTHNPTQFTWQV